MLIIQYAKTIYLSYVKKIDYCTVSEKACKRNPLKTVTKTGACDEKC